MSGEVGYFFCWFCRHVGPNKCDHKYMDTMLMTNESWELNQGGRVKIPKTQTCLMKPRQSKGINRTQKLKLGQKQHKYPNSVLQISKRSNQRQLTRKLEQIFIYQSQTINNINTMTFSLRSVFLIRNVQKSGLKKRLTITNH